MIKAINQLLNRKVPYNRKNFSKRVKISTLIKEETLKQTQYVRGEKSIYKPVSNLRI